MRVAKDLINEVKGFQYQETTHSGRHTEALEKIDKKFNNTT